MKLNNLLFNIEPLTRDSDIVYTPEWVSKQILDFLQPSGFVLDPCKGDGSFFNQIKSKKEYCEIQEGINFFNCSKKFDWIVGNPPYSIFEEFLDHSFKLSDNVSYLVPTNKVFQRQIIMDKINNWGGIKSIIIYGSGSLIGFPFGFSVGNFHFQKKYKGDTKIIMGMKSIFKNN